MNNIEHKNHVPGTGSCAYSGFLNRSMHSDLNNEKSALVVVKIIFSDLTGFRLHKKRAAPATLFSST